MKQIPGMEAEGDHRSQLCDRQFLITQMVLPATSVLRLSNDPASRTCAIQHSPDVRRRRNATKDSEAVKNAISQQS
jgi:hypothetical protein